eukprot:TRINITY_DN279_c3_g1_i1.p1 TRINITY_DN279_c3_g1~~TRINITY_DN279_c3_g1_i1.p1  ORF type:complete len:519 (+),score=165.86 TRINITY_DN279_c3_g1_i1:279-1835(+)
MSHNAKKLEAVKDFRENRPYAAQSKTVRYRPGTVPQHLKGLKAANEAIERINTGRPPKTLSFAQSISTSSSASSSRRGNRSSVGSEKKVDPRLARLSSSSSSSRERDQPRQRIEATEVDSDDEDSDDEQLRRRRARSRARLRAREVDSDDEEEEEKEDVTEENAKVKEEAEEDRKGAAVVAEEDDDDEDEEEIMRRRARARARAREREKEEEEEMERVDDEEDEDGRGARRRGAFGGDDRSGSDESGSSSEYETDSSDDDDEGYFPSTLNAAPVFVSKKNRNTITERKEIEQEEELIEEEKQKRLEERKKETHDLVAEEIRNDLQQAMDAEAQGIAGASGEVENEDDVTETDLDQGLDDMTEYESWKEREMTRIKRSRDERAVVENDRAELVARRKLTDAEIMMVDRQKLAKKEKTKHNFMQKFYHKGAFYQDDESAVVQRRADEGTETDRVDKSLLPKVMQVKRFGRSGQSKYTHLVDQDTTNFESAWSQADGPNRKNLQKMGGMGAVDRPFKRKRT